ncbi:interleukin-11-like [Engraulis encrasicolus]|uniref:interleukin-11-like n=1 Tax=Engraulis encrasicolus TaxID=184585 RepID=UPI002FD254D0
MKLLLGSHVSVDVCLLLVLLPVFSLARPHHVNRSPRRDRGSGLSNLYVQMKKLQRIAHGPFSHDELNMDVRHNFTTLPHITSRAQDMGSLQLNTTLRSIQTGLQSFRFHFEWLQQVWQNRSMPPPPETLQISRSLRHIGQLLQKQIGDPPASPVPPELPALTNHWDIYVSSIAVHKSLQSFSHWSATALHFLMRSSTL